MDYNEPAIELSVSEGSVNYINNALGYAKVWACWVLQSLTDYHTMCGISDVLSCSMADGESLLSWIITVEETWSITLNFDLGRHYAICSNQ
jgi:hypothetical protein